jgi:hypothetical protein
VDLRLKLRPSTWFFLLVAFIATAPAWIVKHPPLEDLPLHLATIRTLRSIHDPAYGMDRDLVLHLGRTQYVIYYILGAGLSFVTGVIGANVVLLSAYLGGTVLALRALLVALGRDERLCLFVLPLLVNEMFVYGLFPFLLGIPIMLWALAMAVRHFEKPTLHTGGLLAALALALFYSHVFPFGIFCIGFAAMFPYAKPSRWLASAAPIVPAVLVLLWWTFFTAAGQLVSGATNGFDSQRSLGASIADIPNWFIDVLRDGSDNVVVIALGALVVAAFGLSLGDSDRTKPIARVYALLPLACIVLYFLLPESHGYIWLIAQRFPILFAITAIPLVRMPRGARGVLVSAAALLLGVGAIANTCKHFIGFERQEVGDIDGAIEAMDPGRHVCALIYDKSSAVVKNVPFLHFGSYYQEAKGGVVMFTFAGYLHWPVDFLPGRYPPPGKPARERWEWTPESVPMSEVFPYYDYVLTRGQGFRPPPGTYHMKWRGDRWTVWAKDS